MKPNILAILFCSFIFSGCAVFFPPDKSFTEYRTEKEEFAPDPWLFGKKIFIDPGHGGISPGAVSKKGLTEKNVNLAVSLHLFGMLKTAGAEPRMTRYTDIDFGETVQADLRARAELINREDCDLMISVHHNSSENKKARKAELYYKSNENGSPSEQFASILLGHLLSGTGINEGVSIKSNFFILRNVLCPAVLTETTFLSNPEMAGKLKTIEASKIEALSIFRAIREYFSKNIPSPVFSGVLPLYDNTPSTVSVIVTQKDISSSLDLSLTGCLMDLSSLETGIESAQALKLSYYTLYKDSGIFNFSYPAKMENGDYILSAQCKNTEGYWSKTAAGKIIIRKKPKTVSLVFTPDYYPASEGAKLPLSIAIRDIEESNIKTGLTAEFSSDSLVFEKNPVSLKDYRIDNYFTVKTSTAQFPQKASFTVKIDTISQNFDIRFSTGGKFLVVETFSAGTRNPLQGCSLNLSPGVSVRTNSGGYAFMDISGLPGNSVIGITKQGYIPAEIALSSQSSTGNLVKRALKLSPSVSENLIGKKIILLFSRDEMPEQEIQALEESLKNTGLIPNIIISQNREDPAVTLAAMEQFGPEIGIQISFEKKYKKKKIKKPLLGHYWSSAKGKRIAELLAENIPDKKEIIPMTDYLINQTSFPFVYFNPQNMPAEELKNIVISCLVKYF